MPESWLCAASAVYPGDLPRFARLLDARGLRASRVAVTAGLVALVSATVAVALGTAPRATATARPPAPSVVHDGPAAQQEPATALSERRVPAQASRAIEAPRPTVAWPAAGAVTGVFGEARRRAGHPGLDIDGTTGDPVWAAAAGVVAWAGWAPAGFSGYGNLVLVDHGGGVQTLYAHLSAIAVSVGQWVEPGDHLGSIGTTGRVTGSHLHFEVRRNGVVTDPTAFLPAR
jgi:murein DD-endopeptidase MepM/ murein hydrolase activator NlpD